MAHAFRAEQDGSFRGDICRAAVLWLHGGLYTDVDVVSTGDWRETLRPAGVTFATARPKNRDGWLFNAVIAASPRHRILQMYLEGLRRFYSGNRSVPIGAQTLLGMARAANVWPRVSRKARYPGDMLYAAVAFAARDASQRERRSWRLLSELRLRDANALLLRANRTFAPLQVGRGSHCNIVVADKAVPAVLFYSRVPGASHMCDTLEGVAAHGSDYKTARERIHARLR